MFKHTSMWTCANKKTPKKVDVGMAGKNIKYNVCYFIITIPLLTVFCQKHSGNQHTSRSVVILKFLNDWSWCFKFRINKQKEIQNIFLTVDG